MDSSKVLLGVLVGVAAGATLGILFAPEKGSVTRQMIADKGENYVDDIKNKFDDFLDTLSSKFESTKNEAEGYVSSAKARYDESRKDGKNLVTV